jgi:hypothetical protein
MILGYMILLWIYPMLNKFDNVVFDRFIHFLSIMDYINVSFTSVTIRKKTSRYKKMKLPYIYLLHSNGRFIKKEYLTSQGEELLLNINPNAFDKESYGFDNHDLIRIALKYGKNAIFKSYVVVRVVPLGFKEGVDPKTHYMQCGLNVEQFADRKFIKYANKSEMLEDEICKKEYVFKSFQNLSKKRKSLRDYIGGWDYYFHELEDFLNNKIDH